MCCYRFDLMKLALPSFTVWLLGFYLGFHCLCNITAELFKYADRQFYRGTLWLCCDPLVSCDRIACLSCCDVPCEFTDFWNATSLDAFWRLVRVYFNHYLPYCFVMVVIWWIVQWNIPVHEWCHRHIYTESMHYAGVSKNIATFTTFLISAVLHELLFSVAFKTFRPWFFVGMLIQIPLIIVSRNFRGKRRGNFIVWLSLFAGQPLLEVRCVDAVDTAIVWLCLVNCQSVALCGPPQVLYFREWFTGHSSFFCVD